MTFTLVYEEVSDPVGPYKSEDFPLKLNLSFERLNILEQQKVIWYFYLCHKLFTYFSVFVSYKQ